MESGSPREFGTTQSHSSSRGSLSVDVGEKGGADSECIDCKMLRTGSDGVGTLRHLWNITSNRESVSSDVVPSRVTRLLRVLTMNADSAGRAEFDVRSGLGLNDDISSRRGTNFRDKLRNALPQARYERLKS
jgi:hypothetical protein